MAAKYGNITLYIGKHDEDVARWFNLLMKSGQSRSLWGNALLVAIDQHLTLNLGVITDAPLEQDKNAQMENKVQAPVGRSRFGGTGTASTVAKKNSANRGWSYRSEEGNLIVGSSFNLRITNRKQVELFHRLKSTGTSLSKQIKAAVREGIRVGKREKPPDRNLALNLVGMYPDFDVISKYGKVVEVRRKGTVQQVDKEREELSGLPNQPVGKTNVNGDDNLRNVTPLAVQHRAPAGRRNPLLSQFS